MSTKDEPTKGNILDAFDAIEAFGVAKHGPHPKGAGFQCPVCQGFRECLPPHNKVLDSSGASVECPIGVASRALTLLVPRYEDRASWLSSEDYPVAHIEFRETW